MTEPALELRSFDYRYPDSRGAALRSVDLRVEHGEMVVLAGRSGSGKSTLLRAASGLVPHFHGGDVAGGARVCGLDLEDHGPAALAPLVGLVAQEPETQVVSATVRAEIELPLEIRRESAAARARATEEVALALGIADLLNRSTASLSGGELQRVALAAAIVGRPKLILLDEPTSQLDPVAGDDLLGVLRRLNEDWGSTVIVAEHRLERCLAAADRVVAFSEGRITADGSPQDFCESMVSSDPALAPPVSLLFSRAGITPVAESVKAARRTLAARGLDFEATPPAPEASQRRKRGTGLSARDLWIELGEGDESRTVLQGLGAEVDRGERVVLMGRNGAGKTTFLRAAAGLVEPFRGRVDAPSGIALVPQSPGAMFVRGTVEEELPGEAGARALELLGLSGLAGFDPRDLSGGERQRLAIAIAMAGREERDLPGVVCLDEPTRGLDQARKASLAAWLTELAAAGAAIVVATHDVEFAARFADRVLLLADGRILADGDPGEILSGGWYFATQVARALNGAAVTPEAGADLIDQLIRAEDHG